MGGFNNISVLFLCKSCRQSYQSIDKFLDHKKKNHFDEYKNIEFIECIVFEEVGFVTRVQNNDHQLINQEEEDGYSPSDVLTSTKLTSETVATALGIEIPSGSSNTDIHADTQDESSDRHLLHLQKIHNGSNLKTNNQTQNPKPSTSKKSDQVPIIIKVETSPEPIKSPQWQTAAAAIMKKYKTIHVAADPPALASAPVPVRTPVPVRAPVPVLAPAPAESYLNFYYQFGPDVKDFVCKSCGAELNTRNELQKHVGACEVFAKHRNRYCFLCNKLYTRAENLKDHNRSAHGFGLRGGSRKMGTSLSPGRRQGSGSKKQCPHCSFNFNYDTSLEKHVKSCHPDQHSSEIGTKPEFPGVNMETDTSDLQIIELDALDDADDEPLNSSTDETEFSNTEHTYAKREFTINPETQIFLIKSEPSDDTSTATAVSINSDGNFLQVQNADSQHIYNFEILETDDMASEILYKIEDPGSGDPPKAETETETEAAFPAIANKRSNRLKNKIKSGSRSKPASASTSRKVKKNDPQIPYVLLKNLSSNSEEIQGESSQNSFKDAGHNTSRRSQRLRRVPIRRSGSAIDLDRDLGVIQNSPAAPPPSKKSAQHQNQHQRQLKKGPNLVCNLCQKKCESVLDLQVHAIACLLSHEELRHLFCIPCNKLFSGPENLRCHNIWCHGKLKPKPKKAAAVFRFQCDKCQKKFMFSSQLQRHLKTHGKKEKPHFLQRRKPVTKEPGESHVRHHKDHRDDQQTSPRQYNKSLKKYPQKY